MPYLIDSDWIIDYLGGLEQALELLESLAADGISLSVISYMEVYEGVIGAGRSEADLEVALAGIPIVAVSKSVCRRCAVLRGALRQQGRRVNSRALDLLIAATAIEHNLALVTRNVADYRDIPDLVIHYPCRD